LFHTTYRKVVRPVLLKEMWGGMSQTWRNQTNDHCWHFQS